MNEDQLFSIGDVVKIKGHSVPIMTVSEVTSTVLGDVFLSVVWFNDQLELKETKGLRQEMFVDSK